MRCSRVCSTSRDSRRFHCRDRRRCSGGSGAGLVIEGRETGGPPPEIRYNVVSEDFFRTMRIPVRSGRGFTSEDRAQTTPLVLITEAAARKFWPGLNPVGAHVRLGPDPSRPWAEVVGVVGDYRQENLDDVPPPLAITFFHQDVWSSMTLSVRTSDAPVEASKKVALAVRELDASARRPESVCADGGHRGEPGPATISRRRCSPCSRAWRSALAIVGVVAASRHMA